MPAGPRTLVIVNHKAANARREWPAINAALKQRDIDFETHFTTHAGDATQAVRSALRAGVEVIGVVGGDGTLSEAANGFFATEVEQSVDLPEAIGDHAVMALLPAGTGDDFARGLSGRREPLSRWLESLVTYCRSPDESATRVVDVIYGKAAGGDSKSHEARFVSLNVATIGLGAEVAGRVGAQGKVMQSLPGEVRFVSAAVGALAAWREKSVRITVDNQIIECRSNLLAVANGVYAGGGMMFAPGASVSDGMLDVLISSGLKRTTILRELPRIRRGAHLSNPQVRVVRTSNVKIETEEEPLPVEADGNVRGITPAEFRVMPGALRILV